MPTTASGKGCTLSVNQTYSTITLQTDAEHTVMHCRAEELNDCYAIVNDFLFHNHTTAGGYDVNDILTFNSNEGLVRCAHAYAEGHNCGKRAAYQITDKLTNAHAVMLRFYVSKSLPLEAVDDASSILASEMDPNAMILWSAEISNEPFDHIRILVLLFE